MITSREVNIYLVSKGAASSFVDTGLVDDAASGVFEPSCRVASGVFESSCRVDAGVASATAGFSSAVWKKTGTLCTPSNFDSDFFQI